MPWDSEGGFVGVGLCADVVAGWYGQEVEECPGTDARSAAGDFEGHNHFSGPGHTENIAGGAFDGLGIGFE